MDGTRLRGLEERIEHVGGTLVAGPVGAVGRVLSKLGARDRLHAAILAHRHGLIPDDPS